MKNKIIALALSVLLFAPCFSAQAQQPAKLPKIGFLGVRPDDSKATFESFKRQFQMLGYVDGKNIVYEYRNAENKLERLPTLVDELIRVKIDVLVVAASNEVRAAKNATKTIPIVGLNLTDPVQSGLIESLAHPGANLTGITPISEELSGKRLELLKEIVPGISRVAVMLNAGNPQSQFELREVQAAAQAMGLQLQPVPISSQDALEEAFAAMSRASAHALIILTDPIFFSQRRKIVELAGRSRLPAMYFFQGFAEEGGLVSYGPSDTDLYRRSATYVDRILRGAKASELPVEQPIKFDLVVNLNAAKALGLDISPMLLARADKVIE